MLLKDKTAVITGASRGIGRAVALKMSENGADVAVIYSGNDEAAAETVRMITEQGTKAVSYKCNVADFSETSELMKKIIEDFGKIDILVNNAGITKDKLILKMSEEDFDSVINVNLKGAFNMIKHVFQPMMKQRSGSIINITSVSGMMGNPGQANYSSSKAGLIGLTKTTAKELARRGVRCNAIAPGFVETDMTNELSDKIKESAVETIPMGHMGKPEDIANLAIFLASELSGYITGEIIKVDGGLYI